MDWESCYETPVEAEAHVVKGFLEHYGVPCVLASDRFQAQPLTFCALGQVRILVPGDWAQVARGLINGRRKKRRRLRTVRRPSVDAPTGVGTRAALKAAPRRRTNG